MEEEKTKYTTIRISDEALNGLKAVQRKYSYRDNSDMNMDKTLLIFINEFKNKIIK